MASQANSHAFSGPDERRVPIPGHKPDQLHLGKAAIPHGLHLMGKRQRRVEMHQRTIGNAVPMPPVPARLKRKVFMAWHVAI